MNPFKGELSQRGYFLWTLLDWLFIVIAGGLVVDLTKKNHQGNYWLGYRIAVATIFLAIFLLVSFRRAQNTKYHPLWSLLILIPYIDVLVWLALIFIPSKRSKKT
jgi:uncharacterized membrane protein YhaH (DUF805 family)